MFPSISSFITFFGQWFDFFLNSVFIFSLSCFLYSLVDLKFSGMSSILCWSGGYLSRAVELQSILFACKDYFFMKFLSSFAFYSLTSISRLPSISFCISMEYAGLSINWEGWPADPIPCLGMRILFMLPFVGGTPEITHSFLKIMSFCPWDDLWFHGVMHCD